MTTLQSRGANGFGNPPGETPEEKKIREASVQVAPTTQQMPGAFVMYLGSLADDTIPWGNNVMARDIQLRQFWPTEPVLASAIYSIVARNSAFSWKLDGPARTVQAMMDIFHNANLGKGWQHMNSQVATDLATQDNGAFVEIIRDGPTAKAIPIGLAHLDAGRCQRTGVPDWPVLYTDRSGGMHKLGPHQVLTFEEFPSPVETMNGVQLCTVSRVLTAAKYMRDILIHNREKVSGSKPKEIAIVNGASPAQISDAISKHYQEQTAQGYTRYIAPAIVGAIDPTQTVSVATIKLASLPDGFNFDELMRWYINQLALGFGADYQDFAPLPGRSLGSSTQSLVLHMKAQGKGPALWMKMWEQKLNFAGVLPDSVTFHYEEKDKAAEREDAEVLDIYARAYSTMIASQAITPAGATQELRDKGYMSQAVADMSMADLTNEVTVDDSERVDQEETRRQNASGQAPSKPIVPVVSPDVEEEPAAKARRQARIPVEDFADAERRGLERELERAMARALRESGKIFIDHASRGKEVKAELDSLIDVMLTNAQMWAAFKGNMIKAMFPLAQKVARNAAQYNAALGLGVDMDKINESVLAYTRAYMTEWWGEISTATQKGLRQALETWQSTGLGKRGLPDLVQSIEPLFGRERAKRIAVTETTRLFDEGNRLAHIEAGVTKEEWQTAHDEYVCPICGPLDGNVYPTNNGPRPVTGTHINCRCMRVPVANDTPINE